MNFCLPNRPAASHFYPRNWLVGLTAWIGLVQAIAAAPQTLEGIKLELIAESSAIQPGVPFKVGLKMNHAAGQHTYWKNPGIVGVPTKLDWKLPKGFVAGEIEWPRPELTMMAIYPVYGYENETLLPVTITPPASLDPSTDREVTLEAAASWMCCGKTCHPGFTTVSITMPTVSKEEKPEPTAAHSLFTKAREALPLKTDAWEVTASMAQGKVIAEIVPASGGPANLEILKTSATDVYFFSSDGLIDSRAKQEISDLPGAAGFRIVLSISEHAPELSKDDGRLEGVLSAKIPWVSGDTFNAIEVAAPIQR